MPTHDRFVRVLAALTFGVVLVSATGASEEPAVGDGATESGGWTWPGWEDVPLGETSVQLGVGETLTLDRTDELLFLAIPAVDGKSVDDSLSAQKRWEPLVAPVPAYNPTFGLTFGGVAGVIYTPPVAGETSSPWLTGVGGFYSETQSWGCGVAHKMNLDDGGWRILGALGYADLRYDFYGIGSQAGKLNIKVPVAQDATVGIAEVMRETLPDLYLGLRYLYAHTSVGLDGARLNLPPGVSLDEIRVKLDLAALVLRLQYDTRDSDFYPTKGVMVDGQAQLYDEMFGGDRDYQSYQLAGNWFWGFAENQVLALRAVGKTAQGGAPFFALPAFGSRNDLRGYVSGQYRDRWLVAGQVEYRLRLWERLGLVAFCGVGSVAPEIDAFDTALPSVGCGLRYVLAKQNNVSFRFDVAWGRDDVAFYFGVGEAF